MKDCASSACEAAASISNAYQTRIHKTSTQCPANTKSVGSVENFWGSYTVVCGMLFDYCMQVMWNAVFYDTVAEYTSAWRKRKVWSGYPKFKIPVGEFRDRGQKPETQTDEDVIRILEFPFLIFALLLLCILQLFFNGFTVAALERICL